MGVEDIITTQKPWLAAAVDEGVRVTVGRKRAATGEAGHGEAEETDDAAGMLGKMALILMEITSGSFKKYRKEHMDR